jgi:hypothetical protein
MFCATDKWWSDATFSYRCRISNNSWDARNWAGFQFRKTNSQDSHDQSGYLVFLRSSGQLVLYCKGATLQETNTGLDVTKPVTIRVQVAGDHIRIFLDDQATPRIDAVDNTYASGYVSLTSCSADVAYDSFTAKTTDGKATP